MKQNILTVLGKDRAGIIASVTGLLYRQGCNLEDISMTVLEGELAMIMVLQAGSSNLAQLKTDLEKLARKKHLSIYWKDAEKPLHRGEKHQRGSQSYLISAFGRDRTGIVYQTTQLLAKNRLNITDLNSRILGKGKRALYMMLLEVDIKSHFPISILEKGLQKLQKTLGVEFKLKATEPIEA